MLTNKTGYPNGCDSDLTSTPIPSPTVSSWSLTLPTSPSSTLFNISLRAENYYGLSQPYSLLVKIQEGKRHKEKSLKTNNYSQESESVSHLKLSTQASTETKENMDGSQWISLGLLLSLVALILLVDFSAFRGWQKGEKTLMLEVILTST